MGKGNRETKKAKKAPEAVKPLVPGALAPVPLVAPRPMKGRK